MSSILLEVSKGNHRWLAKNTFAKRVCALYLEAKTGADRAALDFAIEHGYPHGGWNPRGREAEDGTIPLKYQRTELVDGGYRQRNKHNVGDSNGTLVINTGELDGGTLAIQVFAQMQQKAYFLAQVDTHSLESLALEIAEWLRIHNIRVLNVAGPRESKRPGIYAITRELLELAYAVSK
ncbi:putative molybdenum carrier protein [Allopusillimonas ginsengisoli]|uniref:putative molybdenum carrier protein n=1 Tax=Allopusillimonas ginsengisoli TaxID=453575 RepID=UPI00101F0507|nr:putative molybdenum carrier protein [Allopusillimonas ginsengisoli]TEA70318.1 hypothetical protein ERE07_20850 [Allopusillimonas ginsengisoli]